MSAVTVYTTPKCAQCTLTVNAFQNAGMTPNVVDLSISPDALELVRALGHSQAPVVTVDSEHWSGFQPDRIKSVAARLEAGGSC